MLQFTASSTISCTAIKSSLQTAKQPIMAVQIITKNSPQVWKLFFLYIFFSAAVASVSSQEIPSKSGNSAGVYALPEISLKLQNGTVLETTPNSPVKLLPDVGSVQLTCTADYPVKWEYLVNNKTIPVLDIIYRRLVRNMSDFDNPKRNRFMSMITLRGLLESQSGKYLCRLYNEKLGNNSYAIASFYDLFVPGNRTFNTVSSVSFMNKTAAYVNVHCPVSDPDLHVRLYKLNDQHFNKTGAVVWKPIYANYEPTDGFRLLGGLGRELLGTYNCTADNGVSMISVIADPTEKEHYQSLSPSIFVSINSSCRENYKLVQYIRSRRLECYCRDSFGLFMNDNYEFENRQANCSTEGLPLLLKHVANCSDWRLEEFIMNGEDSQEVCFRGGKETLKKFQEDDDRTGSRPSLKVRGKAYSGFTKLSITYNGFVDWAGDFMMAVCRKELCLFENNDGNRHDKTDTGLEYISNEPTRRQYFPFAHHQAVWNDIIINGTDIRSVYVLQAHSLSYAWFPFAAKIEWDSLDDMNQSAFGNGGTMGTSSSCSIFSKLTSCLNHFIYSCFIIIITFYCY